MSKISQGTVHGLFGISWTVEEIVREELFDEDIYAVFREWERRQDLQEEDVAPMLQEIMAALDVEPDIYAEVYAHAEDRCRGWHGALPKPSSLN